MTRAVVSKKRRRERAHSLAIVAALEDEAQRMTALLARASKPVRLTGLEPDGPGQAEMTLVSAKVLKGDPYIQVKIKAPGEAERLAWVRGRADGVWSDLCRVVGVDRHPLFADMEP